jgi:mannose-6-phosphate isomerase-like protein (cupin superfamily)
MKIVEKKWGREIIFANNDMYCGKLLIHDKAGSKGSMHFHMKKHETFYVQQGSFKIHWIDPTDASRHECIIKVGDTFVNQPGDTHQIEALEDNSVIIEVSTKHEDSDSYRVMPGDGQ